jgi:DNA-binding XRE family transcriptional regulator
MIHAALIEDRRLAVLEVKDALVARVSSRHLLARKVTVAPAEAWLNSPQLLTLRQQAHFYSVYRGATYWTSGFSSRMDLRDVFAANLRRLRNAKGLSQEALAYDAEISRSYLSQIEKGVFYVSLKIIGRLSETLDVDPAEFLRLPASPLSRRKW